MVFISSILSHKNHVYLLDALKIIISKKTNNIGFIFCGRDKGNLILSKIKLLNMIYIIILKFWVILVMRN